MRVEIAPGSLTEVGAREVGHLEVALLHVGVDKDRFRQVRIEEGRGEQVGVFKVGTPNDRLLEGDAL